MERRSTHKQTNEFAAHEQLRAVDTQLYKRLQIQNRNFPENDYEDFVQISVVYRDHLSK
jgi:hypothetical protein